MGASTTALLFNVSEERTVCVPSDFTLSDSARFAVPGTYHVSAFAKGMGKTESAAGYHFVSFSIGASTMALVLLDC